MDELEDDLRARIERHVYEWGGYCKHGHLWAGNGFLGSDGKLRCRACHREWDAAYKRKRKEMRRLLRVAESERRGRDAAARRNR